MVAWDKVIWSGKWSRHKLHAWCYVRCHEIDIETLFSNKLKRESFNVLDRLTLFNSRLIDIKLSVEIARPPRSYKKFGHDWKASEYRNFLIFHGVPVMIDMLPKEQLAH